MAKIKPKTFINVRKEDYEAETTTQSNIDEDKSIEETDMEDNVMETEETNPPTAKTTESKFKPITKREIDKKAEEIKAKRQLPKAPSKSVDFDTMVSWLNLLTKDMWSHVVIYVYRHLPVIDRLKLDPNGVKYIDVLSEPLPSYYEYMVDKHGGGKYGFMVIDTDRDKEDNYKNHIFDTKLTISMSQHEPKLDYRELDMNSRENIPYINRLRSQGKIDERGNPMTSNNPNGGGNNANNNNNSTDVVALMKEFGNIYSKLTADQQTKLRDKIDPEQASLSQSIGNLLLEKMKQEDPSKTVSMITAMIQAMKADQPKPDNSSMELFKQMIQMQSDNTKTIIEMMKLQIESNKPVESKSDETEFDKILKLIEIAEKLKGGRGGGGSAWDKGLEIAKEVAVPVFNAINNIIALKRQQGGVPIVNNPNMNPNMTPPIPQHIQQIQQPEMVANPAATSASQQGGNEMGWNGAIPPTEQLRGFLYQYGGMVLNQINAGKKGWEFAEDLINFTNSPAVHTMIARHGEDKIVEVLKSVPEFWNQVESVYGEEFLKKWVSDFCHYEEFLEGENEGEDSKE